MGGGARGRAGGSTGCEKRDPRETRQSLFHATVQQSVKGGWTRLEAWPEGELGLRGWAFGVGPAHARGGGATGPLGGAATQSGLLTA